MNTKEDRIKFLVFSAAYPYRGGISDSTHSLCNELISSGINTEVWTFSLLYPGFLFPGNSQYSNEKYDQKFKIHRLVNTVNPFNWIKVSKMANKIMPDSIIFRYWSPILVLPYFFIGLFLNKEIKVIGLIDNWDNHEKVPFEKLLRKFFLNTCDKFISMSENVGIQVKKSTNKKVLSLFHPINLNLPRPADKKTAKINLGLNDKTYISFIGLIRKYKGLETLIRSMKLINRNDIKLIIAGEFYEPVDKYLNLINDLDLNNKIIINDKFLDSKMIRDYICASELIVLPYINASQSGITPLAYFYNKPLVVSKVRGLKEIINKDQSGEVFDKTPENLAKAILNCIDEKRNQLFVSNIIKAKKYYSWSTFVEKIKTI